jgi:cyclin T
MDIDWPPAPSTWLLSQRDLLSCPSVEAGMEFEEIERLSAKSADFIQRAGTELRLPQMTIATALIFFHRHFTVKSFAGTDHFTLAIAACFLAGKVEDTPKKLKDTVMTMQKLRLRAENPTEEESLWPPPSSSGKKPEETSEYLRVKKDVLQMELELMKTLNFDLNVEHSYKYVLAYAKQLGAERDLAQVAWNFCNDSLRTRLCVQYQAKPLAAGAIFLAAKFLKPKYDHLLHGQFDAIYGAHARARAPTCAHPLSVRGTADILCHRGVLVAVVWFAAAAGAQQVDMEEIANQILDLYERGAAASIRPTLGKGKGKGDGDGEGSAASDGKSEVRGGVAAQARRDRATDGREGRAHRPY